MAKPSLAGVEHERPRVLRPDATAIAAELARVQEQAAASARDAARYRAALAEISCWWCDNRQLVALSALGQLENS